MTPLQVSLLLGALAHAAAHTAPQPACLEGTLDRVEWITDTVGVAVVEVPDYPTLQLPGALATGMRDGTAVDVCAQVEGHSLRVWLGVDETRERKRQAVE